MCTRIWYTNKKGAASDKKFMLVGRTLDWNCDTNTRLWAYPKGMKRDGGIDSGSITWETHYRSITASIFDCATVDGMNEAGLVANMLYLAEANYNTAASSGKPSLSIGAWPQYVLDNFATVAEAVAAMREEPFRIVAHDMPTPGKDKAGAHLALSDATGDSAIFEYIDVRAWVDGKECNEPTLVIHHGPQYKVMTNSPTYDAQLAIRDYWADVGGCLEDGKPPTCKATAMLPGTHRAADRFVRASYNLTLAPDEADARTALAATLSMARSVSVPVGVNDPSKPNNSTTIWRTVSDVQGKRYLFDSVYSPTVFWVDLEKIGLPEGGEVLKLDLKRDEMPAGDAREQFTPAEPFAWLK